MPANIKVMTIANAQEWSSQIAPNWDPNPLGCDDYASKRALALYKALGVSVDDHEFALCQASDGRWALIGLSVEGHRYAVETPRKPRHAVETLREPSP